MSRPVDPELERLFAEYRSTRDRAVRNRLIEAHLDWASMVARRFRGRGEPVDDLAQVAQLGLLKAVERFDPERGVPFTAFAEVTVTGELKRHFRDTTWAVRVPRRSQELAAEVRRAADELTGQLGRAPRLAELAERLGVPVEDVVLGLDASSAYRADSLDPAPTEDSPGGRVIGAPDPLLENAADRVALDAVLAELAPREREILRLRFDEQKSQSEIAAIVGVSQMHVSRLLRRSIEELRSRLQTSPGA